MYRTHETDWTSVSFEITVLAAVAGNRSHPIRRARTSASRRVQDREFLYHPGATRGWLRRPSRSAICRRNGRDHLRRRAWKQRRSRGDCRRSRTASNGRRVRHWRPSRSDRGLGSAPPRFNSSSVLHSSHPSASSRITKKSGVMHDAEPLPVGRTVIQLDGRNLIVMLEHRAIVLKFEYRWKLNAMAFKLACDTHVFAGIASGDVTAAATNPPRRLRTANVRLPLVRRLGDCVPPTRQGPGRSTFKRPPAPLINLFLLPLAALL